MWLSQIPRRLMRITSSGHYLPEIDGLRFMAILPVLLQHLSERLIRYAGEGRYAPPADNELAFLASRGTVGVFLFFAISGFILALPFARNTLQGRPRMRYRDYLLRRITRLEPPYIVWMCCFFIVLLLKGDFSFGELFPHLAASLLYVHNLVYLDYSWINPVAWSLEIEIQFYLLAPFLAALFWKIPGHGLRRMVLILVIALFISVQALAGWTAEMPYKATLLGQLPHFLVGFLLVDFYLEDGLQPARHRRWVWDLAGLFSFVLLLYSWSSEWGKSLLFALALGLFFASGFRGRILRSLLRNVWVAAIGGMCYTIYLIHLPLMEGLARVLQPLAFSGYYAFDLLLVAAVVLPFVLLVSAVCFLALERPFMDRRWPARLSARLGKPLETVKKAIS